MQLDAHAMPRPNVLLICTDHWPANLLGCAGHPHILSPTLDQLAANGVRYSRAYSTTPICIPARRALMTGTTAQTHGDRTFREREPMPADLPTVPAVFRAAGYQAYAVGKLHVYPQRDRIGFEDVLLNEEGRHHLDDVKDDYERHLEQAGYAGQELTHAMGSNMYTTRPWHLPEACHPTNWTVREMCRVIQRRDPTKPALWYCSFAAPHPPVTPPAPYLDMYQPADLSLPAVGDWASDFDNWPYALKARYHAWHGMSEHQVRLALAGFYAQCTYIDHQMRLLIGQLSEAGELDNTIIMFTSDHGDMLGQHGLWAKPPLYDGAANVSLILVPTAGDDRVGHHRTDDRLACLRDVMPTLLELCDIDCPETVEGHSLVSGEPRASIYAEAFEGELATRMVRDERHKLIWYPIGNRLQLFDLSNDPEELHDLAGQPAAADIQARLSKLLVDNCYGSDTGWLDAGELVGEADRPFQTPPLRNLLAQRGWR
jgi:arylsulfatase